MLRITVHERTYRLASGVRMAEMKKAVLEAMRAAPAFLALRTADGGPVEVTIAATTAVVLEEQDDPLPSIPRAEGADPDDGMLCDIDFL